MGLLPETPLKTKFEDRGYFLSWIGPVIWNLRLKSLCMQRFVQTKSQKSRQLNLHLTHRCLQAGHTFEPKKSCWSSHMNQTMIQHPRWAFNLGCSIRFSTQTPSLKTWGAAAKVWAKKSETMKSRPHPYFWKWKIKVQKIKFSVPGVC